jgi:phage shock protein A
MIDRQPRVGDTMKNKKKQIDEYRKDFELELANLKDEIESYLKLSKSEYATHNDISSNIRLINWASRTLSANRVDLDTKISMFESN